MAEIGWNDLPEDMQQRILHFILPIQDFELRVVRHFALGRRSADKSEICEVGIIHLIRAGVYGLEGPFRQLRASFIPPRA